MKVVIAGGGTAGHVNPAIALARALEGDTVVFVGTARGSEARLVPDAGFALEKIEVEGLDRGALRRTPLVALRAIRAWFQARRLLKRLVPDVVVGMGGYVSLPVCLAARTRRIPLVLHEQNAVLGLANRVCKRFARNVAVSFEESLEQAGPRGVVVGNPVLPEIARCDRDLEGERGRKRFGLTAGRRTLLVFGGSQGARRLNEAAVGLRELWKERTDRQVVHILGTARAAERAAEAAGDVYKTVDYLERMSEAYAIADLVVCRGGATTIAEITVFGVPAVVVPYPHHRDRQQEIQGRILERAGAAVVVDDADADAHTIATIADELLSDDERLAEMRHAARRFGKPDAAYRLAEVVREAA